jgi:hypothetical protein
MSFNRELLNTKVHVATQTDADPVKVFYGLLPLCGATLKDCSVILTVSDLAIELLHEDEYICPLCAEHEDYPLLLLASSGEE